MPMCEEHKFHPTGNDLRRVMYYYGVPLDDQITCPFHDDNRPSCHVDYDDGTFYCFACGVAGDAFDFVKLANPKLNGLMALRLYFNILSSKKVKHLKNSAIRKSKKKKQKDKTYLLEVAHDYFFGLRSVDWKNYDGEYKPYLKQRGFNSNILIKEQVKLTETNKSFPIIFPIYDNGIFRGYVCRTTLKHVEKRGKYLYNEGFSRIDTLGGNYKNDTVVLCEGYLDGIKLRQFGLKYVASIFGWKITAKQVEKLRQAGVKYIISALDTDKPGRKGTDHLKNFFEVVEFQFPKGVKDPGEMNEQQFEIAYKKTKALFRKQIKK